MVHSTSYGAFELVAHTHTKKITVVFIQTIWSSSFLMKRNRGALHNYFNWTYREKQNQTLSTALQRNTPVPKAIY